MTANPRRIGNLNEEAAVASPALPSTTDCPRCGKPMAPGTVRTHGAATFRTPQGEFWGSALGGRVNLGPRFYQAWRCEACRLVLMDYNQVG